MLWCAVPTACPSGPSCAERGVRFRLWAPAARRVELVLEDGAGHAWDMPACGGGWFELLTDAASAGSRYRYRINGELLVPDPASRFNPEDVQGPSLVVDPRAFAWSDGNWRGRPWHESVVYELHTGTFSPEGTFAGIASRLDHLVELGVTTLELMPIADFPGRRSWGYDGVLPFAPDSSYGTPDMLKALVDAAHQRKLAVMLDVVYNHFGPQGNYLNAYAPQFFTERHHTPWGAAINFDGADSRTVRDFYIHNACYWIEEYHLDGLRFDAINAICDDSTPDVLTEIAAAVRSGPGRDRATYLVLENAHNEARYLGAPGSPEHFDAQWNDDEHHCLHVILTGEKDGYYADYANHPHALLCRCLAEGFAYQGEHSQHEDAKRGEPSGHLPPTAFVPFLQNHDQIGNRALGERLSQLVQDQAALRAALTVLLLAPSPPLLFMGEEWAAAQPFPYFCDFEPELAAKVRAGRQREFARFSAFGGVELPDACALDTFESARLRWEDRSKPQHSAWLDFYRRLLTVRRRDIVPLIPSMGSSRCVKLNDAAAFAVDWSLDDGATLHLITNLTPVAAPGARRAADRAFLAGRVIFATHPDIEGAIAKKELAPWSVTWLLERSRVQ